MGNSQQQISILDPTGDKVIQFLSDKAIIQEKHDSQRRNLLESLSQKQVTDKFQSENLLTEKFQSDNHKYCTERRLSEPTESDSVYGLEKCNLIIRQPNQKDDDLIYIPLAIQDNKARIEFLYMYSTLLNLIKLGVLGNQGTTDQMYKEKNHDIFMYDHKESIKLLLSNFDANSEKEFQNVPINLVKCADIAILEKYDDIFQLKKVLANSIDYLVDYCGFNDDTYERELVYPDFWVTTNESMSKNTMKRTLSKENTFSNDCMKFSEEDNVDSDPIKQFIDRPHIPKISCTGGKSVSNISLSNFDEHSDDSDQNTSFCMHRPSEPSESQEYQTPKSPTKEFLQQNIDSLLFENKIVREEQKNRTKTKNSRKCLIQEGPYKDLEIFYLNDDYLQLKPADISYDSLYLTNPHNDSKHDYHNDSDNEKKSIKEALDNSDQDPRKIFSKVECNGMIADTPNKIITPMQVTPQKNLRFKACLNNSITNTPNNDKLLEGSCYNTNDFSSQYNDPQRYVSCQVGDSSHKYSSNYNTNQFRVTTNFVNNLSVDQLYDKQQICELQCEKTKRIWYIGQVANCYMDHSIMHISTIPHGNGVKFFEDDSKLKGFFIDGISNGPGTFYLSNGLKLKKGHFFHDLLNGFGKLYYQNGRLYYEGNFLNDNFENEGIEYTNIGKKSYIGSYKNGLYNGFGIKLYDNNDVYEGNWEDGLKHGEGKLKKEDGSYLDGLWQTDVFISGKEFGKLYRFVKPPLPNENIDIIHLQHESPPVRLHTEESDYPKINDNIQENQFCWYFGDISDKKAHGNGVEYFENESRYEGEFVNNKRHGKGVLWNKNGVRVSKGIFIDGLLNGLGKIYNGENGVIEKRGFFKNEFLEGEGVIYDSYGKVLYQGAFVKNIKEGYGIFYNKIAEKYEGNFVNDQKEGKGKEWYIDGSKYEGLFQNNYRHGYGEVYHTNGDFYKGDWYKDTIFGNGELFSKADKTNYVGEFANNEKNGYGVMTNLSNKEKYEGNWVDSQKSGLGDFFYKNGDVYKGNWSQNQKNGSGTLTHKKDLTVYKGNFIDDQISGKGKLTYPLKDICYIGEFKKEKPNGFGRIYELSTRRKLFVGHFKDEVKHGQGIEYYANGDYYEGCFCNGSREGSGKLFDNSDFKMYDGQWKNGFKDGIGFEHLKGSNGHWYHGSFFKGIKNGKGEEHFSNGDKYEGEFKNGKKHGNGVFVYREQNGVIYKGIWKNGCMEGNGVFEDETGKVVKKGCYKNGMFCLKV